MQKRGQKRLVIMPAFDHLTHQKSKTEDHHQTTYFFHFLIIFLIKTSVFHANKQPKNMFISEYCTIKSDELQKIKHV